MLGSRVMEVLEASLTGVLPRVTGLKSLVPGGALCSCLFERDLPYILFLQRVFSPFQEENRNSLVYSLFFYSIPIVFQI